MEVTSVTSKGQVTIPKELRQQLGIRQGSRIEFSLVGDHVEMRVRQLAAGEARQRVRHAQEPARRRAGGLRPGHAAQAMIGLDTNVLARYYVDDKADAEAQRQRVAARRLIESGQPLMVSKSVVLELEWVMRGYYGFAPAEVASVLRHLLAQAHVTVEDRDAGRASTFQLRSGHRFR